MLLYIATAIAAYFIGNIQFAVIISRLKFHDDVRNYGSGNAGSTNMLRVYGIKSGSITFAGDFLKAVLSIIIGRLISGEMGAYISSVFVVIGHCYPVLFNFKGGKGVASSFGIAYMLNPLFGVIVTLLCLPVLLLWRMISLVSMFGITIYLILTLTLGFDNKAFVITAAILWVFIIIRHLDNIKRIIKGEESKVFNKKQL